MSNLTVVLGAQWGDEGKGKIVDLLSEAAFAVVRFQGGHNAGHTIVVKDKTVKLHLIPSGILHERVHCFIAQGVVVSLVALWQELESLCALNISAKHRLMISERCPLVLNYHAALDQAREKHKGNDAIGTTGRGIGPAYEDKIARRAILLGDLWRPEILRQKLNENLTQANFLLEKFYNVSPIDIQKTENELLFYADKIKPFVGPVKETLRKLVAVKKKILFEGAQGTLLDIDHGTYPFVTSSNTTLAGVLSGTGLTLNANTKILGITKAYATRVGAGPFPTELFDEVGAKLGERGQEFGTTTGRKRRCGWLDIVALREAVLVNGLTHLCITKLDVLDTLPEIKICVAYQKGADRIDTFPVSLEDLTHCQPIYETLPGWLTSTQGIRAYKKLSKNAKRYLEHISKLVDVPITMISTGPERNETIVC